MKNTRVPSSRIRLPATTPAKSPSGGLRLRAFPCCSVRRRPHSKATPAPWRDVIPGSRCHAGSVTFRCRVWRLLICGRISRTGIPAGRSVVNCCGRWRSRSKTMVKSFYCSTAAVFLRTSSALPAVRPRSVRSVKSHSPTIGVATRQSVIIVITINRFPIAAVPVVLRG